MFDHPPEIGDVATGSTSPSARRNHAVAAALSASRGKGLSMPIICANVLPKQLDNSTKTGVPMTTTVAARRLDIADDYLHVVGDESNWNESRYIDFHDAGSGLGGWFRIGMRPNEGHAEMSACIM